MNPRIASSGDSKINMGSSDFSRSLNTNESPPMVNLQSEIEGEGAVLATEDLLQIEGLSSTHEVETETPREKVLAMIATMVAIIAGSLTIAEQLYTWYQNYRRKQTKLKLSPTFLSAAFSSSK
ncbi:hypothetical protein [Leptodesmis sp.]|uniref:hypothetical protein n=1 Tax=Leptodesmis sp. TaxID=3100501 RepID=UPI00405347E6